jgi:endonuclease/exonuclease/phosphatase family metal-dependent hydrolase
MIHIGTINVHEWFNQENKFSFDTLIEIINDVDLDIIGLQETTLNAVKKVVVLLPKYQYIYNNKTAILSKYPIRKYNYTHLNERCVYGMVILPHNLKQIFVTCVHLDYKREPTRIKEIRNIMSNINTYLNRFPSILLGDFNSLTRSDYNSKEWEKVIQGRVSTNWEYPVSNLTDKLKSPENWGLIDIRNNCKNVLGPIGTCKFNTRIDYLFINKLFLQYWNIYLVKHTITMPIATDHNLVFGIFHSKL